MIASHDDALGLISFDFVSFHAEEDNIDVDVVA